jgi:hypothetical protein
MPGGARQQVQQFMAEELDHGLAAIGHLIDQLAAGGLRRATGHG